MVETTYGTVKIMNVRKIIKIVLLLALVYVVPICIVTNTLSNTSDVVTRGLLLNKWKTDSDRTVKYSAEILIPSLDRTSLYPIDNISYEAFNSMIVGQTITIVMPNTHNRSIYAALGIVFSFFFILSSITIAIGWFLTKKSDKLLSWINS